jgi:hypothetical protein
VPEWDSSTIPRSALADLCRVFCGDRLGARRSKLAFYKAFLQEPLLVQDGALQVPATPGPGLTVNRDDLRGRTVEA